MSKDFGFSRDDSTRVFAVVMISYDSVGDSMAIEPLGIYSSLQKALECAVELESCTATKFSSSASSTELIFDVLEFNMDEEPVILEVLKTRKERLEKELDKTIIDLMKKGLVDQLIGEDGNFYYTLTKEGKDRVGSMKLPKYISKLFKDKND